MGSSLGKKPPRKKVHHRNMARRPSPKQHERSIDESKKNFNIIL
jgi:hypothetical protein